MKFIFKSEIIDYDYFDSNSKNTILFLHGWGGNKNSFLSTINLLKNTFNIISITMPTIENTNTIWDLSDYRELVLRILSCHNFSNVIIICHSFGFRVACKLNGFINIEKIVATGGAGLRKINIFKTIENTNNSILLRQKKFNYLYNLIASKDYIALSKINKLTFKNIVNEDCKNLISFNCPMLLFWGKFDSSTPIWIAKKIKQKNSAKLYVVNSDHFAYLNKNALFNNLVRKFVYD